MTLPAPHPSNTPVEKHPLRLQLSASIGRGALDGAWWPYSRDLAIEAVDLVDHFPAGFDRICHVAHSTQDGDAGRRKHRHQRLRQARFVPARRHPPRYLGRGVSANSGQVLQLLVVPSDWDWPPDMPREPPPPQSITKSATTILLESQDQDRAGLLLHWDDDG